MRKLFVLFLCVGSLFAFAPVSQQNFSIWDTPEFTPIMPSQSNDIYYAFAEKYGTEWSFSWSPQTGLPHRIFGKGILVGEPSNEKEAEQICRSFIRKNPEIFSPECDFELLHARKVMNTWIVIFREKYNGLPVLTGRADFRIKNGNLIMIGADIHPQLNVSVVPKISAETAKNIASQRFPNSSSTSELVVAPFDGDKLVWHIYAENDSPAHRYHIFVDANTGDILWWWDNIKTYYGNVTAMVHPLYEVDSPQSVLMKYLHVEDEHGDTSLTDESGAYIIDEPFVNGTIIFGVLMGPYADVTPVSTVHSICGGGATSENLNIHFGEDCAGIDETGGYYHTVLCHSYFKALDPDYTSMDYPVPITVSDTVDPCPLNAFWDGYGIHLGAGGGGYYRNFGLYADVIYHEYTHGVTHYIYPFDMLPYSDQPGALDEAFSDFFACAITGEHYIGELGLIIGVDWMRNLDNDLKYPDDWAGEVHDDSRIISAAWWEIREAVSPHTWGDSLVHFTRFTLANNFNDFALEMLILDDNDGNLDNGTPNDDEIIEAYLRHGIGDFGVKISHTPHKDTENTIEPYRIRAELNAFTAIRWTQIFYSTDAESFYTIEMMETDTDNVWEGFIPAQPLGTKVYYYLWAEDWRGFADTLPIGAPESLFMFHVTTDTIAPVIYHNKIWDQSEYAHPFFVGAKITDNCAGAISANIVYYKNSETSPETVSMIYNGNDAFSASMLFTDGIAVGDTIHYAIEAHDGASVPNFARMPADGYFSFLIVRSFFFDFEADSGEFVNTDGGGWEWGVPTYGPASAFSGVNVWGTVLDGPYSDNAEYLLETPSLDLTDFSTAILQFHFWLESEMRYDGGTVLIVLDDTARILIEPIDRYPVRIIRALNENPGYSGNMTSWQFATFDLSAFVGHNIELQFLFASDEEQNGAGWYIDDVAILETSLLLPPFNFRAESGYDEIIPLAWNSPSEAVIEYLLYRNTELMLPLEPIATIAGHLTNYEDTDVMNGQMYYYWLAARYERGNSVPVGPAVAIPFAASIMISPESFDVTLLRNQTLDTMITVQNIGTGGLFVDIFELPVEEEFAHYTYCAPIDRTAIEQLAENAFAGHIGFDLPAVIETDALVPDDSMWHLLATDPQEMVEQDLSAMWGQVKSNATTAGYFKVSGYHNFGNIDSFMVAFMLDTDRNPSTGYPEGGGIEYMVMVGNFMGSPGMILEYDPSSPYGWNMVGEPNWIFYSDDVDTVEAGFAISLLGNPIAAYVRCGIMRGLAGTTAEMIDMIPDTTEPPIEFYLFDAKWLFETPVVDVIPQGEMHMPSISFDATGLTPNVYQAFLQFKSNDREHPDLRIPVTLNVISGVCEGNAKPTGVTLNSISPSPFNSATEISFTISNAQKIRIEIFDELGRNVRTLPDKEYSTGNHSIIWNGNDNSGKSLPSGIFLVRLTAGENVFIKRTAIIR